MAVTSAIKFVQGVNVGTPGVALIGVLATAVTVTNGSNAGGVTSWKWTMLDVPPGSSVPTGVISDGGLNSISFSPDVRGGYHVELVVRGSDGTTATDRRVFQVPELSGRIIPPFRAEAPALNFGGSSRGWADIMDNWLHETDGRAPLTFSGTGAQPAMTSVDPVTGIAAYAVRATGASPTIQGVAGGYDGRRLIVFCANATTFANESGSASAANRVTTGSGVDLPVQAGGVVLLIYEGASSRWRVLGGGGGTPGGSDGQFQYNSSGTFAGQGRLTFVAGEVNHSGTPLHNEDKAVFVGSNGYATAESEWDDARTTDAADTVLFTVFVDSGVGDCHVSITWKLLCSGPGGGGTIVRETTYKRVSGTWTPIADVNVSDGAWLEIAASVFASTPDAQNITLVGNGIAATNINWMTSVHAQVVKTAT